MCWLLAFTLYSHGSAVALPGGGEARPAGVGAGVSGRSNCRAFLQSLSFRLSVVLCGHEAALFC